MNILISGGCKNGKSYYAQKLALSMAQEKSLPLYYLATMIPVDDEDRVRIERHLKEREGWGFDTIERGLDICGCLKGRTVSGEAVHPEGVFLLDSVTALLSRCSGRTGRSISRLPKESPPTFRNLPSEQEIPSSYRTTYILTHSHMNRSPKNTGAVWPAQIAGWPGYATGY